MVSNMEIAWTLCFDDFFFGGYIWCHCHSSQYENDFFFNIKIYISQQDVQYKGYEKGAFVE